jgi:hypothetical protein
MLKHEQEVIGTYGIDETGTFFPFTFRFALYRFSTVNVIGLCVLFQLFSMFISVLLETGGSPVHH